jgi:hypothetical protein
MNEHLRRLGLRDWQVFNLAADGGGLTPMLYVYARIASLKPEIVIYGDHMPYYRSKNADANSLQAKHYAYLNKTFNANSNTAPIWRAYQETLQKHGWHPPAQTTSPEESRFLFEPRQRTTLSDILVRFFVVARQSRIVEGPPLPIRFETHRNWEERPYSMPPDPEFGYFQGVRLIAEIQRQHDGRLFFYFSSSFERKNNLTYNATLNDVFGSYLTEHGILFASYVALGLKPIYETYDGVHQTMYGNDVVARAILNDLKKHGLVLGR